MTEMWGRNIVVIPPIMLDDEDVLPTPSRMGLGEVYGSPRDGEGTRIREKSPIFLSDT